MLTKKIFLLDNTAMISGHVPLESQLLGGPKYTDADRASPLVEQVPPLGQDATLLAVVPVPGTGTSLAIVGYVITSSAEPVGPAETVMTSVPGGQPRSVMPRKAISEPGGLRLDHVQRRVWADGQEIQLTFQEFELLAFLTAHPAAVFTRADLVDQVWHRDGPPGLPDSRTNPPGSRTSPPGSRAVPPDSRTVDVHVSRLRHKLGPRYGQCLVTEYRVGYQFRPLAP